MSYPDYSQTVEDHQSLLILVKQVGCHLKPKVFSSLYERVSRVTSVHIHSQQRRIRLRYLRTYPIENNEWGDFQAHRKAIGLICIGKCDNENEVTEIYRLYEDLDQAYSHTLYDSRLFLFGLNKDGSVLERRLRKLSETDSGIREMDSDLRREDLENSNADSQLDNHSDKNRKHLSPRTSPRTSPSKSPTADLKDRPTNVRSPRTSPKHSTVQRAQNLDSFKPKRTLPLKEQASAAKPHVLCYPREDQCPDLEEVLQDYVASLFWILESKRLDRSYERQEKPPLLMTPFEKKELASVDTDTRAYKKRCQGRLRKHLGDLCLMSGLPGEALLHYQTALDILKSASDWMWYGGAFEGICAATISIAQPNAEVSGFPRNFSFSSFSLKRGKSASKENRIKSGNLNRGLSNGVDLEDSRCRTNLAVDDIIEKYRESILNYSKFQSSGVIELETSLKACRFATTHSRYLAAADFLQNVVYINLPLSDEEKIERYIVMGTMYDEVGFHRKGALFKRLAGMQCVAMSNPKPAWLQCYHLLIKALEGYKLSLDPKDIPEDRPYGWPLVQMRVLHEIIFTARKMGNPAIAIRHLCYLLHTMFHHLVPAERKELSSILESYTVRCEAAPQSLALENGAILPPVPFLRFPVVKSFKLQEAPPHLRPVRLRPPEDTEASTTFMDLFIYSPLQCAKVVTSTEVLWVEGDLCGVIMQLYNPMPHELKITQLGLITDGVNCEMIPQSLTLPPESGPFQVKVTFRPLEPGELNILGYSTCVLGVKSLCRLRDLPHLTDAKMKVKVVPRLPTLQVATSLPKESSFSSLANSDMVVTSATACIYAGESVECELKLTNSSKQSVEYISMSVTSKGEKSGQREMLVWNEDNLKSQLPIQPGAQACLTVYISSMCDISNCDISGDNTDGIGSNSAPKEDGSFGQYTESLLKLQYSGSTCLENDHCRQCAVAMTIEVQPSIIIRKWDLQPTANVTQCQLTLDVENVTHHTVKLISDEKSLGSIGPTHSQRCLLLIPKCNMSQSQSAVSTDEGICMSQSSKASDHSARNSDSAMLSWQRGILREHLQNFVDVRWKMPCEGKNGRLSLEGLVLTPADVSLLQSGFAKWDVSVAGETSDSSESVTCRCGQATNIQWSMESQTDDALHSLCVNLRVYHGHKSWHKDANLLHSDVLVCGSDSIVVDQLSLGQTITGSCDLIFTHTGSYKLEVVCQGRGHSNDHGHSGLSPVSAHDEKDGTVEFRSHSAVKTITVQDASGNI